MVLDQWQFFFLSIKVNNIIAAFNNSVFLSLNDFIAY